MSDHGIQVVRSISTHTPLAGRDNTWRNCVLTTGISTHTPLAGRDLGGSCDTSLFDDFYSHAPCGARHPSGNGNSHTGKFLLTRPLRGATCNLSRKSRFSIISTHTPLAGRDVAPADFHEVLSDFYSHAPCGARPVPGAIQISSDHFYSHAPCGARPQLPPST